MSKVVYFGLKTEEEVRISKESTISLELRVAFKLFDTEKERKIFINTHNGTKMESFDITEDIIQAFNFKNKEQIYEELKKQYKNSIIKSKELVYKKLGIKKEK